MAEQNSVLTQIARPYAAALFDLAKSEGSVDAVEAGLVDLQKLAGENADFARFLRSPVISADEKSGVVASILGKAGLNPTVNNLVKVVARNGRLFALPAIIKAFQALAAQQRGEVSADVTSATPLSKAQVSSLADTLKKKIGKTVTIYVGKKPPTYDTNEGALTFEDKTPIEGIPYFAGDPPKGTPAETPGPDRDAWKADKIECIRAFDPPPSIVDRLSELFVAANNDPKVKEVLATFVLEPAIGLKESNALYQRELPVWMETAKNLGLEPA